MTDPIPPGTSRLSRRVLVADDEENIRRLVQQIFRVKRREIGGVEVLSAESAEEALVILETERVDLVLTDYRMGGKTGAELLAEVQSRWPGTERVLMTGYREIAEAKPETVRATAIIQKPWDNAAFVRTLRSLLPADSEPAASGQ